MLTLESVKIIIEKLLNENGYELYSFIYHRNILEIIVDREDPIGIDEITDISQKISLLLDENDFTESSYTLDVSSLGVEKPIDITKLDKYIGKYVSLHLSHPYKGMNNFEGEIKEIKDGIMLFIYMDKARAIKCMIPIKDIDKAKLAIKF